MPEYYSLEEVAGRLGKSEDNVREMVNGGDLRAFRDGGTLKFRRADIDALAPGDAPVSLEQETEVLAEPEGEEEDELLFLIDEDGTPGDPDDLTLIGESDEDAVFGMEGGEDLFGEGADVGVAVEEPVDDEAPTEVVETSAVAEAMPAEEAAPDLFAEAEEELAAVEAEGEEVGAAFADTRAARLQRERQAAKQRNPIMSLLLVLGFLVLVWTGIIMYNSFVTGARPAFIDEVLSKVKIG